MFSERRRLARPAVLLLLAAGLAACGRMGPPQPPPSRQPAAVADLSVQQRAERLIFRFSYPTVTVGGLPLSGVDAVEVWGLATLWDPTPPAVDVEAAEMPETAGSTDTDTTSTEDAVAPAPARAPLPQMNPATFQGRARSLTRLAGEVLRSSIDGGHIVFSIDPADLARLEVAAPAAATPEEADETATPVAGSSPAIPAYFLSVRVSSPEGRTSLDSNLVLAIPAPAPPRIVDLRAGAEEEGIRLQWTPPAGGALEAVAVYRRGEGEAGFGSPRTHVSPTVDEFFDADVVQGRAYVYALAAVARLDPRVEGVRSAEAMVEFADHYPPSPPLRLAAFPQPEGVRLIWEGSSSRDVVGYRIERRSGEGPFEILTPEPVSGGEYVDRGTGSGGRYVYRVLAVDRAGNTSEPSAESFVRVP